MLGIALGLSAAFGFGASAIFVRLGLQYMRATTGTLVSLVVGTVVTMGLALAFLRDEVFSLSGVALLWLLLAGVINFPLGRLLNFTGVHLAGVSRSTALVGSSPLFATIAAITLGGETITLPVLLGTLAIIGGLALVMSQR